VPKEETKMDCGEFVCCTKEGENLVGIGCGIGNVKVQRKNVNKFVLDTATKLIGKVERRPR
jgi:hypothetical protein